MHGDPGHHRTICIGDPHSCLDELRELFDKLKVTSRDTVVILGDLIDRGPDPVGVVRFCRENNCLAVKGNHEAKMEKWFLRERQQKETGRKNQMKPPKEQRLIEWNAIYEDDRNWLAGLPLFMKIAPGWLAVHAGFQDTPFDSQPAEVMTMVRYVDAVTGRFKGYERDSLKQPPGTVPWMAKWRNTAHVAYGHAVHSLGSLRIDTGAMGGQTFGLDTGCVFGGRLTALILETKEVVQVQARRKYCEMPVDML